jgi:hypothetical protein
MNTINKEEAKANKILLVSTIVLVALVSTLAACGVA